MKNELLTSDDELLINDGGGHFEREEIVLKKRVQPGVLVLGWIALVFGCAMAITNSYLIQLVLFLLIVFIFKVLSTLDNRSLITRYVDAREMNPATFVDQFLLAQMFLSTTCFFFVAQDRFVFGVVSENGK